MRKLATKRESRENRNLAVGRLHIRRVVGVWRKILFGFTFDKNEIKKRNGSKNDEGRKENKKAAAAEEEEQEEEEDDDDDDDDEEEGMRG